MYLSRGLILLKPQENQITRRLLFLDKTYENKTLKSLPPSWVIQTEVEKINKKAYVPALAVLVLALLFAFIVMTAMPEVKATAVELIKAFS